MPCQTNAKSSLVSAGQSRLGDQKLAPFEEGGIMVRLEPGSWIEVAVEIEVLVKRSGA